MKPNKPTTFVVINGAVKACLAIKGWILGPRVRVTTTVPDGYRCDPMAYVRWCYELGLTPGTWN